MMKTTITFIFALFLFLNISGQGNNIESIEELVAQGTALHDQGKYAEAIKKYKAALKADKNSPLANYEIAYTYLSMGKYDDAIKHSEKVINLNGNYQHIAYVVMGSAWTSKAKRAMLLKFMKKD
ncbi:MAG: tetratricopeptide repeat protein [Bacteroidales bacterium]|nr:tetratricopeptide repeat protein [Bacteroidales bacterium]